jgi:tRNA G46 methylase TrmB
MERYPTDSIKFKSFGKIKMKIFHIKRIYDLYLINKKNEIINNNFKRTAQIVSNDYHAKGWYDVLKNKKWLQQDKLIDFVLDSKNPTISNEQTSYIDNKICNITQGEYALFRKEILNFYITENIDDSDTIVELGCGWGLNLWTILANNPQKKLEGYELSENGLKSCIEINHHFNCDVSFGNIDLTKNSTFPILENKIIFTFHVLEQLKYETCTIIENILKCKPHMVLHFEPVPELYENSDHEKLVKQYIQFSDYQDNLLSTLKKFESDGKITIIETKRLYFAANPLYETCFIKWIPNNS